jgi:hypothetical protein
VGNIRHLIKATLILMSLKNIVADIMFNKAVTELLLSNLIKDRMLETKLNSVEDRVV